jgi:hypothetical protein
MIIQRKRTRGWRWPINAIYVGRPTKWGNPHKVGSSLYAADEAVNRFRRDLIIGALHITIEDVKRELRGRDLVCWCAPADPCHAYVLLAVANW